MKVKENSLRQTEHNLEMEWLAYEAQIDKDDILLENKILKLFCLSLGYTYDDIVSKVREELNESIK